MGKNISLGIGLIGIGRPWGHTNQTVPSEEEALTFLQMAYTLGITYYDTAASYGLSEERVGKFIHSLTSKQRETMTIATKFGDHWDAEKQTAYVDHSFKALKDSLDRSIKHLDKVDLLYLHKASIEALTSPDVEKAFVYAQSLGIKRFGASVSDELSGEFVCNNPFYSVIQLPYNQANTTFGEVIDLAKANKKNVVINRPFNMGSMLYNSSKQHTLDDKITAYKAILEKDFQGTILTGTKSPEHLLENLKAFKAAQKELQI